jgi:hypothetical protein
MPEMQKNNRFAAAARPFCAYCAVLVTAAKILLLQLPAQILYLALSRFYKSLRLVRADFFFAQQ